MNTIISQLLKTSADSDFKTLSRPKTCGVDQLDGHPSILPPLIYGTAWKEERTQPLVELALDQGFRTIEAAICDANQAVVVVCWREASCSSNHSTRSSAGRTVVGGTRAVCWLPRRRFSHQRKSKSNMLPHDAILDGEHVSL